MTSHGKINLLAMLGLPVAATCAALFVFGLRPWALVAVFAMNLVVMLCGGLFAASLLRTSRRAGGRGTTIALAPSVAPAVLGAVWYLFRAASPEAVAPGREYLAGPQYLLMLAVASWVLAWIAGRILRLGRVAG